MEQEKPATPWYRQPIWLGLVGLAVMIVGYKVSTYLPEREDRAARSLTELDEMRAGEHQELGERLRGLMPEPPYRWPGRLLLFAGVMLFVSAGVMMARQPAAPRENPAAPPADDPVP